jgi:hypothetical protein
MKKIRRMWDPLQFTDERNGNTFIVTWDSHTSLFTFRFRCVVAQRLMPSDDINILNWPRNPRGRPYALWRRDWWRHTWEVPCQLNLRITSKIELLIKKTCQYFIILFLSPTLHYSHASMRPCLLNQIVNKNVYTVIKIKCVRLTSFRVFLLFPCRTLYVFKR